MKSKFFAIFLTLNMKMILGFCLWAFLAGDGNPFSQLDLKADLKKDNVHLVYLPDQGKMVTGTRPEIFTKYAQLNLTGYTFNSFHIKSYDVKSWTSADHKIIIDEVITSIAVDTFYRQPVLAADSSTKKTSARADKKLHIKGNFLFHTYIIRDKNQPELIYQTERNRGLCEYRIGKHRYLPVYIDLILGFPDPDLSEILKIVSS